MSSLTYDQVIKLNELEKQLIAKLSRARTLVENWMETNRVYLIQLQTAIEKLQTNIENVSSELIPFQRREPQTDTGEQTVFEPSKETMLLRVTFIHAIEVH